MIVPLPRRQRTSEENVLPLINIVFLLLIFFMIAGAISRSAPFELDPPEATSAREAPAPTSGIAIGPDGQLAFDGRTVALSRVGERARDWIEQRAEPGSPLPIRADRRAPSGRLLEVVRAVRQVGVEQVRLLAVGPEQP